MSNQVNVEFTYHNVGQGLFYSGKIGDFNFVYDCGAEIRQAGGHLKRVVNDYLTNKLTNKTIDLLVISHLHEDHISGLRYLFAQDIDVNTVILPYLSPIERLIVALNNVNLPNWTYDFWADPATYLTSKKATVVFMGNGKADNEGENNTDDIFDVNKLPDDHELKKKILDNENWEPSAKILSNLRFKNHSRPIRISNYWLFKFFNRQIKDEKRLANFQQYVNNRYGTNIKDIIKNREALRVIKNQYLSMGIQNLNETSLVMFHGLNNHISRATVNVPTQVNSANKRSIIYRNAAGHLLTGDIDLNSNLSDLQHHFNGYLLSVESALVPHHGAGHNWNKAVLKLIPRPCLWIISSGIGNNYGHPSDDVCDDIRQDGHILDYANQGTEVCNHEKLIV